LWLCLLVGGANALAWAMVDPVGQGPDESAHIAEVDYIALHGKPPTAFGGPGGEIQLLYYGLPFSQDGDPSFSPAQSQMVRRGLDAAPLGSTPSYVINNPPLYYAVAAAPTRIISHANLLDRVLVMRVVSVVLCLLTIAFSFLFVREVLPAQPWAWTVGGMAVALQPVLAFMGGAVSPDDLLFASAAALFFALSRAFRRGLSYRRAAGIGVAALAGCLTKGTMFGLLPGAAFGTLFCAWRQRDRRAVAALGVGAASIAVPFGAWLWANTHLFSQAAANLTSGAGSGGLTKLELLRGLASYTWQMFLPRLSSMHVQFRRFFNPVAPGVPPFPAFPQGNPFWEIYVQGIIGRFGFYQYEFPFLAEVVAGLVLAVLAALGAWFVWRTVLRPRRAWGELSTYVLMVLGNFMLVTYVGYFYRHATGGVDFEQARYLFPLIPLYGLAVAAACRALGRHRGRILGGVLIVLAAGHAIGAVLLTLGRFYG